MNSPAHDNRRLFVQTSILAVTLILIAGLSVIYVLTDPGLQVAIQFPRTAFEIDHAYHGAVDWDRAFDRGMQAMLNGLDPYTGYVDSDQFDQLDEEMTGSYVGIGVTVTQHEDGLLIMSVREDGPAAQTSVYTGDIIYQVDTVSLANRDATESVTFLRGPEDSDVDIHCYRPATGDSLEFTVTRRRIDFQHIPYAGITPDNLLYIRLLDFDMGASSEVEAAVDSLLLSADHSPEGVILDLSNNPGGLVSEAREVADIFLDGGRFIVGTKGRSIWNTEKYYSTGVDLTDGLPMAVIVDGGSASASEIVAGALHQLGRAQLVGDTTFGKGLVQQYTRFADGSGMRITASRYYLEGDLFISRFDSTLGELNSGLVPDVYARGVGVNRFTNQLEASMLLRDFATTHSQKIATSRFDSTNSSRWLKRFSDFADSAGFRFISSTTHDAISLQMAVTLEGAPHSIRRKVQDIVEEAKNLDHDEIDRNAWYILYRLRHLAWEREYGLYRTYADIIIPFRPDIRAASELLLKEPSTTEGI